MKSAGRFSLAEDVFAEAVAPDLEVADDGKQHVEVDPFEDLLLRQQRQPPLKINGLCSLVQDVDSYIFVDLEEVCKFHSLARVLLLIELFDHLLSQCV